MVKEVSAKRWAFLMFAFTFATQLKHLKSLAQSKDTIKKVEEFVLENLDMLYEDDNLRDFFLDNYHLTKKNGKSKKKLSASEYLKSCKDHYKKEKFHDNVLDWVEVKILKRRRTLRNMYLTRVKEELFNTDTEY